MEGSTDFLKLCGVLDRSPLKRCIKRVIKRDFKLLCQLMTSKLLPRSNTETLLTSANLFLMDMIFTYKKVNLLAIVINNIRNFVNAILKGIGYPTGS